MNRRSSSITVRLTVTLGVITTFVFGTAGLLLYRSLALELQRADEEQLLGKMEVVRHFIGEARAARDIGALRHHLDDVLIGHGDLRVWLQTTNGNLFYGGDIPSRIDSASGARSRIRTSDGTVMEAMETALIDIGPLPDLRALVAVDARPRERLLAGYRNALVVVGVLGVLLTIGLGALAAWRGLATVKRLSAQAASLNPRMPQMRLVDEHVDAELEGLVGAFNGALERLEVAYRQMEAFNADVAHELRTPLATMISGAQLMLSTQRPASEMRDALASNLEELEQLKALVNDMLFLARADQGDRAEGAQLTQLEEAVDATIDYCSALLDEAGVSAIREGKAVFVCNPSLIRRALVNLLSNAVRHSPRGAQVSIRIEALNGPIRISAFNPGEPIPTKTANLMFNRFFRGDQARVRNGESHGLGLAIVRAVALMHGGTVFVESGGGGNRVGFEIPAPVPHAGCQRK